ncbi:serine protease [Earliella scabrosa]|nr:serine protease [Earliella scabrosa]
MQLFAVVTAALSLLAPVLAAPSPQLKTVQKSSTGTLVPNSYIVKLKDGTDKDAHLDWLGESHGDAANVTHAQWSSDVLHGYAGVLHPDALDALLAHEDVEYIEEDGRMSASVLTTQSGAPWGLQRISQNPPLPPNSSPFDLVYNYRFDSSAGFGTDIYVIDTGINIDHNDFGGRARWGATFGPYRSADGNGHGTHCAGTAAGTRFGVAKLANLIAVKVLGDDSFGSTSDIIAGVNWVVLQARISRRPSIASMSLGGGPSIALDTAVDNEFKVAAGNDDIDANNVSPARAAGAFTVGASDIRDVRADFSNYGTALNIFAPGVNVISAWITGPGSVQVLSGTSMATPHVSGLTAITISQFGSAPPSAVFGFIQQNALRGVLSDIPVGTINLLARNTQ